MCESVRVCHSFFFENYQTGRTLRLWTYITLPFALRSRSFLQIFIQTFIIRRFVWKNRQEKILGPAISAICKARYDISVMRRAHLILWRNIWKPKWNRIELNHQNKTEKKERKSIQQTFRCHPSRRVAFSFLMERKTIVGHVDACCQILINLK